MDYVTSKLAIPSHVKMPLNKLSFSERRLKCLRFWLEELDRLCVDFQFGLNLGAFPEIIKRSIKVRLSFAHIPELTSKTKSEIKAWIEKENLPSDTIQKEISGKIRSEVIALFRKLAEEQALKIYT